MGYGYQNKISHLYDAAVVQAASDGEEWKKVCTLMGKLYNYEFINILMVYMQKPGSSMVTDYDSWKRTGRYVRRGSKGIAVFSSKALEPHIHYVFDISDTGGRGIKPGWKLGKDMMETYAFYLQGGKDAGREYGKETAENVVKAFTEETAGVIIDSEFAERIEEFNQAAGSRQFKDNGIMREITAEEALGRSIEYIICTRCGFTMTDEMQDFSFITAFKDEQEIYRLGSLASDISCEVLKCISNDLLKIEERGIVYGKDRNNVPRRGGRDAVPGFGTARNSRENDAAGQVRSEGGGIPERKLQGQVSGSGHDWKTGGEDAGSGRGGSLEDGSAGGRFLKSPQPKEPGNHDGDVAVKTAGKDVSRGNRDDRNRSEIPLKIFSVNKEEIQRKAELEQEIKQELKEIDGALSSGIKEGSYMQASFSFGMDGQLSLPGKYQYKKTEQELTVPKEYISQMLLRGSSLSGSRDRIYHIFQDISDAGERIRALKKEYGKSGAGWPLDGTGLHGYDTLHGKGVRFFWRDGHGEKEGYASWKQIEGELSALINAGEYYQPPEQAFTGDIKQAEEREEIQSTENGRKKEALWLLPLKNYFNHESQYIAVKTLIYDIFTTNLDMKEKTEFLASIYGEKRDGFLMAGYADNVYGKCRMERGRDGITIIYPQADGRKAEKKAGYEYCAYLILHMIEENEYLSEGMFERFKEASEAFTAMPWFMEIYHDYKKRMEQDMLLETGGGSLQDKEEIIETGTQAQENHEDIENTEHVQADILDNDSNVIHTEESSYASQGIGQADKMDAINPGLLKAVGIYLQECSAAVPYQPFLQMVYKSSLSKDEKLSFLKRVVNNKDGKSYHNNAYGLIEYTGSLNGLEVNYKTSAGERKKEAVTYGQLFLVMGDLIKANVFVGTVRQKEYEKEFQDKDMEQKTPLEQEFTRKLASIDKNLSGGNFHFDGAGLPETSLTKNGKAGAKTRYQWNVDAVKLLKKIEHEEREATPKEQGILAHFAGWGGIPQAFDKDNEGWKREYEELKGLLTEMEYEDARETVNTAFYTSPVISQAIYTALEQFGFQKGTILEPALGTGHFFGALPEKFEGSRLFGVEKDSISGRIAKLLYPKADIKIRGFEETQFPDNFFDIAIGNVPFGDFRVYDNRYAKHKFQIHDYFLAKALDKVRPGGIVAFVTSKGTMDKANASARKYFAARADLIGAVRLPNTAFRESAGTDVTSDIIFLQKREQKTVTEPDWVHLGMTEDNIPVNAYFAGHPEMMLGTMEYDTRMFGKESRYTTCINHEENFDLKTALDKAVKNLNGRITDRIGLDVEELQTDVLDADPDVKNYTYTFVDGQLYYRENSKMYKKEIPATAEERIRLMNEIRTITRQLIFLQMEGCSTEELKAQQELLNEKYDTYVKKHGPLSGRVSRQAFQDDADYPLLCSLEVTDENGKTKKADMFYKRTVRPENSIDRVETAAEALNVSVNEYGAVDIPFMLSIYEPPCSVITEAETKRTLLLKELSGLIYLDPAEYSLENLNMGWKTADEYLSGNVRNKLRLAQASLKTNGELFSANVEALEKVQPEWLDVSEIEVKIGTTWIEPVDYEGFIYSLLKTPASARNDMHGYGGGIQVKLSTYNMEWHIENKQMDKHSIAATKTYGTGRMDAYRIFEETLNLRTVTVRDRVDDGDGKYHYEVNKKETMLAREKQDQMKEAFKSWIFSEPDRRKKYVDYYNETFNNTRLREYDGSYLAFPGMNPEITLRQHQKNAVAHILLGGNTLLAHCVGAGKTFTMMAACMEQKRLGFASKNVMVVPKSLIGQTAGEFLRLYPSASILVATERDFEKSRRKQFVSRIATGDYDCIIMSHSQFEKIPISTKRKADMLEKQIQEITEGIQEMKYERGEKWTVKQMEIQKKKLKEQLQSLTDEEKKDDVITFEELGIDSVMVDEAHHFKNMSIFSKINNVSGISSSGSKKAMDMFLKCQYLNEINPGRGIVFATGTPVSNTMCELYVMQLYLQKQALENRGIRHFDSWAANFGEITTSLELSVEGSGFRFKSRFNKFTNLPELMTTFREVADVQTPDMLKLPVPGTRGGKPIIVESGPDWYVKTVMEDFVKRAEAIRTGNVDPSVDNFLKITGEARLLGTDARLLDSSAPDNPDGKLHKVVENVAEEYFKGNENGKTGCQLVFSDIGTPKVSWSSDWEEKVKQGMKFDVYNFIKTELVKLGIPSVEIAYIHDAKTDAQRETLFKEVRTGKKKILIGSTDQCGTGVNVQTHLTAMHHVDCPWKPSCIEQREGRGKRQGNENKEIAIYRYVTKSTFDAYSWSLVENKQRFISQVMTSRAVSRTCADIDESVLSYAEIKAVATGNPLIREKMQLENDVQRLKMLKSSYDSQRYTLQDNFMVKYPKLIAATKAKLACVKEDAREMEAVLLTEPDFAVQIGKIRFTERTDGGTAMLEAISRCKNGETSHIGEYKGFEVLIEKNYIGLHNIVLRGQADYKAELSTSPVGNMVKLENLFHNIPQGIPELEKRAVQYQRDMEQSQAEYEKPFVQEAEFKEKTARLDKLNIQLGLEDSRTENAVKGNESSMVAEVGSYHKKTDMNSR